MFVKSCSLLLFHHTESMVDFHPDFLLWSFSLWRKQAFPDQSSAVPDPSVALLPVDWLLAVAPPLLFPASGSWDLSRLQFLPNHALPLRLKIWIRKWYWVSLWQGVLSGRSGRVSGSKEAYCARFLKQKRGDSPLLLPAAEKCPETVAVLSKHLKNYSYLG